VTQHDSQTDATLAATTDGPGTRPPRADAQRLERGTSIGRYVVLGELGAGGMGVVYAAYDPELDRKVALKLLRADGEGAGASEGRTRLLREAQALAKLSHPNIVAVYDAGEHHGAVWLAMEYVEGVTLAAWVRGQARRMDEVLEVMVDAGVGLAAAHQAGLVHRDFKPDNVMVSPDGRVRVMDLGLARSIAGPSDQDENEFGRDTLRSVQVTRAGAMLGTPAYMAPEQFEGGTVDARADQFSFCVTLWEGLYGERPFAGATLLELATNVLAGDRRPVPSDRRVPTWVREIVTRGLCVNPDQRWPDLPSLLAALEKGRGRVRVKRALLAVAAVAVMVLAGLSVRHYDLARRTRECMEVGASIDAVWNDGARAGLRAGIVATNEPYAELTASKVIPWLDQYATDWTKVRTQVCLDTHVHRTWDADTEDRALWCLDDRALEVASFVDQLAAADATAVQRAVTAAADLASIEPCGDRDWLVKMPAPPPSAQRADIREIREQLALAGSLEAAGKYDAGLVEARTALELADRLAWPPANAEATLQLGVLHGALADYAESEALLEQAYFAGARAGDRHTMAAAATELVSVVGDRLARPADALRWSYHAELALVGIDASGLGAAQLLNNVGNVHNAAGRWPEAKQAQEAALSIRERVLGPDHPAVAMTLNNYGTIHYATGEHAQAKELLGRAIAIRERTLGPEHPNLAQSLANLSTIHLLAGEYDQAEVLGERALAIAEAAFGPDHTLVASVLIGLAEARTQAGDLGQALAMLHRALTIFETAYGPDHPNVASALNNIGGVQMSMGEHDLARASFERALATFEATYGPEWTQLAYPLIGLAQTALAPGGVAADAQAYADRALALREAAGVTGVELAEAHFTLARAIAAAGGDPERARELAVRAREVYAEVGHAQRLADADAWLAEHSD
jgi:eukaryotic-like serine/threonine-protein kinase